MGKTGDCNVAPGATLDLEKLEQRRRSRKRCEKSPNENKISYGLRVARRLPWQVCGGAAGVTHGGR